MDEQQLVRAVRRGTRGSVGYQIARGVALFVAIAMVVIFIALMAT